MSQMVCCAGRRDVLSDRGPYVGASDPSQDIGCGEVSLAV